MGLVSKSVLKSSASVFKSFRDIPRDKHGAERSVATRNSLPCKNNVRFDAPVLYSEWLACAAHSCHHFICYEQDAVLAANLGDTRDVTFRRHHRAKSCANNRFEYESGGRVCVVFRKERIQIIGAGKMALGESFFERTMIAKAGSDVPPLRE